MLDPKLFRTDIETTAAQLAKRGFELNTTLLSQLEEHLRHYDEVETWCQKNVDAATTTWTFS